MFPITTLTAAGPELPGNGGRPTPDQLRYLQRLIGPLLEGRLLAELYDVILLVILALFTIRHIVKTARNRHKQRAVEQQPEQTYKDDSHIHSSSSSSTLEGSASSTDSSSIQKPPHFDLERQPLLSSSTQAPSSSSPSPSPKPPPTILSRAHRTIHAWLIYQPAPIPIINKTLPSNGTTLLVLLYLAINLTIQLYHTPTSPSLLFAPADRAGLIFITNLPLLYLLAAKNQPLKPLTGLSYETLNILHRRVGELMCLEALLHCLGMIVWVRATAPDWLQDRFSDFFHTWLVINGLVAFGAYEVLYLTSLASFRQRWYELFLASHVLLQALGLIMLWLHQRNARPYVAAALAIFVCDRLVWRLLVRSARLQNVDLMVLEDGETVRVSADWDITSSSRPNTMEAKLRGVWNRVIGQDIKSGGWRPADHVFISIDELGVTHKLQAHPFTIASAAPELSDASPPSSLTEEEVEGDSSSSSSRHAWFSLLIRAQHEDGFTSALLRHARLHRTVTMRVDGPYGSHAPLDMLRGSKVSVLVAGGSGIAVIFPLAWSLARSDVAKGQQGRRRRRRRRIHVFWVVHSALHHESWIPADRIQELREMGVEVTLPGPTVVDGRPDVGAYIGDLLSEGGDEQFGVVVSGPDGLNRSVRNACSRAVGEGKDVKVSVEKFGW